MPRYTINWRHISPPNPEFTLQYDVSSRTFKPPRCAWTDQATSCAYGIDESVAKLTIARMAWSEPVDNLGYSEECLTVTAHSEIEVPADGCTSTNFTWTYDGLTPQKLGNNPSSEPRISCYERQSIHYYYVIQNPSTRTPDIYTYIHYRGTNPSHSDLSSTLGTDLARAICWKESTWRQFDGVGRPLFNKNSNGTTDWGCMQINQALPNQIWDWRDNVQQGLSLLAQKKQLATNYLNQHGPVSDELILHETIQLYNGGHYYKWNSASNRWDASPPDGPNGYVASIMNLIQGKPWGALLDLEDILGSGESALSEL